MARLSPRLSVIVPTRDRAEILRLTLPRLLEQTLESPYEVVVADDGSRDDTPQILRDLARPGLIVVRQSAPSGAAAARNRAIAAASGAILVFLDDDAFVGSGFLAAHAAAHARPVAIAVTGPIVEVSSVPAADRPAGLLRGWHLNPFPTGNVSVPRAAVLAAGGFDEAFAGYGWEDSELYRRLLLTGIRRAYCRAAPIFHYKPAQTRADFAARLARERQRGAAGALYAARHPQLAVALQTKQLAAFQRLAVLADRWFGLGARVEAMVQGGTPPASGLQRALLAHFAEIDAGRAARDRLACASLRDADRSHG